jgi:hypothetical protein
VFAIRVAGGQFRRGTNGAFTRHRCAERASREDHKRLVTAILYLPDAERVTMRGSTGPE